MMTEKIMLDEKCELPSWVDPQEFLEWTDEGKIIAHNRDQNDDQFFYVIVEFSSDQKFRHQDEIHLQVLRFFGDENMPTCVSVDYEISYLENNRASIYLDLIKYFIGY